MRTSLSVIATLWIAGPALGQSADERAMMVEGWARGEWQDIYTASRESREAAWITPPAEQLPWTAWRVKAHSGFVVEGTTAFGDVWYAEFLEGTYRDFDGFDGEERVNAMDLDIVDYSVHAADEWHLIYRRSQPENYFSELRVMGDLFMWSNYFEDEDGRKWRDLISISKLVSANE